MCQQAVERVGRHGLALVARHLAAGVHAGVGAAGNRERHRPAKGRKRGLELGLHGAQPGLRRPAREGRAVVFDEKAGGQRSAGLARDDDDVLVVHGHRCRPRPC